MARLQGKVVLVTGGNRGIGKAVARGMAKEGAKVVLAARDAESLNRAAEEMTATGASVLAVPCDVTDEAQVVDLFARALAHFDRLDVLVNNAGAFDGGPLDQLSAEAWDRVIAVNLRAPFLCTREAMRVMKRQGGGRIINVGSISAQRVRPGSAPYSASKHGLWGLTQVTALEGRDHNVTCGCLHPGNVMVERRLASGKAEDEEPMMTPEELAETAVLMACLPPHVNLLEAIVLPARQLYVGRG